MNPAIWSAIVTTLGLVVIALIADRQSKRGARATNALAERVVNREDFAAIVAELRTSLAEVKADLKSVETELESEVVARKDADARAERAERRAIAAEERATALERRVTQLEQVLRENGIDPPPHSTD